VVALFFVGLQQVDFDELDPDVQALVPPAVRYGRINPCMLVVPMGWSWAVWLVQRKHEHIVGGVAEAFGASLVSDFSPPPVMSGDTLLMSMYIDNLLVQGANAERVTACRRAGSAALRAAGLPMHEETDAEKEVNTLGVYQSGSPPVVRLSDARFARLRATLEAVFGGGSSVRSSSRS
jgi:hypothetical protein